MLWKHMESWLNKGVNQPERLTQHEKLTEITARLGAEFGVNPELHEPAAHWARQWQRELRSAGYAKTLDPQALLTARDIALEVCPEVPLDENGKPSFQTQYLAQRIFCEIGDNVQGAYRSSFEGDGLRPIPHFDRRDEIVGILLKARDEEIFPFNTNRTELPQAERNLPKTLVRGGLDEARFWFASCYFMRGQIESVTAVRALSRLYDARPELFDPYAVIDIERMEVEGEMINYGLGSGSTINSDIWVRNAKRLIDQCGGDPRKLFEGTTDYSVLLSRIQNKRGNGFLGFQEKMTSMLAYWYMSAELIPYHHHPLPVDVHVARISSATHVVTYENLPANNDVYSPQTLALLREMYYDYSTSYGTSQLDLCDVIWAHGKAMCGDAVGNVSLEPEGRDVRLGRKKLLVREDITFDKGQMTRYERTCGSCPIADQCEHTMPTKPYYRKGILELYDRPVPPQDGFFEPRDMHARNPGRL